MQHRYIVDSRFGLRMRALRENLGLSLRDLERPTLSSKSKLHKIETGQTKPSAETAHLIDEALNAGGELVALVHMGQYQQPRAAGRTSVGLSRAEVVNPPGRGMPPAAAMEVFRSADRRLGGAHLYATVVGYLHTDMAPALFGNTVGSDGRSDFAAAAAVTEMAGWMAHDMGRDVAAQRHFNRAFDLAGVASDSRIQAHVLASMSHLAEHRGEPEAAMRAACQGAEKLANGPRDPGLVARLAAMQARAAANMGQPRDCVQLLVRAEKVIEKASEEAPSPWVSRFDEGSLASETIRCMLRLGDGQEVQRQAERVMSLRPGAAAPRSRAFGMLAFVSTLVVRGELERACGLGREVVESTVSLGSHLVLQQLSELLRSLAPLRGVGVVADFLAQVEPILLHRFWLYERLAGDRARGSGMAGDQR